MALDPKAAAAAAEAAAAAARAAAEAARAEAAAAEAAAADAAAEPAASEADAPDRSASTAASLPTVAATTGARAAVDTGATLSGSPQGDGSQIAGLGEIDAAALGGGRDAALLDLPGLEAATDGGGSVDAPALGSFQSGGDATQAGASVNDSNAWGQVAWIPGTIVRMIASAPGVAYDAAKEAVTEYVEESFGPKETTGPTTEDGVDAGPGDEEVDPEGAGTEGASDRDLDAGTPDDDDSDDPAAGGTTAPPDPPSGADVSDVPPEDREFVKPPGWVDIDGFGRLGAGNILDAGSGRQSGTSTGGPQPQGGDWAVNPSPESSIGTNAQGVVDRMTNTDWLGQPSAPDSDRMAAGDLTAVSPPSMLDPNTVNPSSGDGGGSSEGEEQASTAYEAMPAAAGDTSGAGTGIGGTESASLGNEGDLTATMPIDDNGGLTGATDGSTGDRAMPFAMPPVDDDERQGRGHGHGRDGERGHGRGRDDGGEDLE